MYTYIYIYIERERDIDICMYRDIHRYICIHRYIDTWIHTPRKYRYICALRKFSRHCVTMTGHFSL